MDGTFEEYVNSRGTALLRFAYVLCGDRLIPYASTTWTPGQ